MAISISTNGDQRTVTLTYTANIDKVDATLYAVAEAVYNSSSIFSPSVPFSSLTNQQKLNLVDDFVKDAIRKKARQFIVAQDIEAAAASINSTVDDGIM